MTADRYSTEAERHALTPTGERHVYDTDESGYGTLISAALADLARGWWVLILCAFIGVALTLFLARFSRPVYEAHMVFAQREEDNATRGVASLAAQLGFDLRPPNSSNVELYSTLLTDPSLTQFLVEHDPHFLERLYPNQWDGETQSWHAPQGLRATVTGWIKTLAGLPAWVPPDAATAAQDLENQVEISEARKSNFRTLTIRGADPGFALWLMTTLENGTDELIRQRAREKSERRIVYLTDQLRTATEMAQRQALAELLRQEEQRLMLSRIDSNYAVQLVSPPEVIPVPAGKRLRSPLLLGFFGGALCGVFLVLFRGSRRHSPFLRSR